MEGLIHTQIRDEFDLWVTNWEDKLEANCLLEKELAGHNADIFFHGNKDEDANWRQLSCAETNWEDKSKHIRSKMGRIWRQIVLRKAEVEDKSKQIGWRRVARCSQIENIMCTSWNDRVKKIPTCWRNGLWQDVGSRAKIYDQLSSTMAWRTYSYTTLML